MDIKEMVKDNRQVEFLRYQNSEFWYKTETGFEFPIPLEDTAGAIFLPKDKAFYFMRWIKKHIANIEQGKSQTLESAK